MIVESEPDIPPAATRMIASLRHDPTAIRRLFESGEYPYKTPMRAKATVVSGMADAMAFQVA